MAKTTKKTKIFQFGEIIPGLKIDGEDAPYPVINDRSVRAGAGIMLMMGLFAFTNALLLRNLLYLKIVVVIFALEFAIRVLINPKLAPINIIADWIVSNQRPEWVGSVQKRFAWSLGLVLATSMIFIVFLFQIRGAVPFSVCIFCLTLMWFETSFGICIGCKIYNGLIKAGIIKPKVKQACPGGVCSLKNPNK